MCVRVCVYSCVFTCVRARAFDEYVCARTCVQTKALVKCKRKSNAFKLHLHKQHSKAGLLNLPFCCDRSIEKLDTRPSIRFTRITLAPVPR